MKNNGYTNRFATDSVKHARNSVVIQIMHKHQTSFTTCFLWSDCFHWAMVLCDTVYKVNGSELIKCDPQRYYFYRRYLKTKQFSSFIDLTGAIKLSVINLQYIYFYLKHKVDKNFYDLQGESKVWIYIFYLVKFLAAFCLTYYNTTAVLTLCVYWTILYLNYPVLKIDLRFNTNSNFSCWDQ